MPSSRKSYFGLSSLFPGKQQPILDGSTRKELMQYTLNLLQYLEENEKLLILCVSCLSIDSRRQIIESIFSENEKKTYEEYVTNFYEDSYKTLYNANDLASNIMRLILERNWEITWKSLTEKLCMLIKNEQQSLAHYRCELDDRIHKLAEIFALSDADCAVLKLWSLAISMPHDSLKELLTEVNYNEMQRRIAIATGLSLADVKLSLSKTGVLYTSRIIESINPDGYEHIVLSDEIVEFLNDIAGDDLLARYVRWDTEPVFPLHNFNVSEDDISIIMSLLKSKQPCNILLYGEPGTGKTQFARSVAAHTHRKIFMLSYSGNHESIIRESIGSRLKAVAIAMKIAEKNDAILIIDEADALLNTESFFFFDVQDKGLINDLLDRNAAQCIWISNRVNGVSYSTMRRFNFNISFKQFDATRRMFIWNSLLKRSKIGKYFTTHIIYKLSQKYAVNAAEIANAIQTLELMYTKKRISQERILPVLEKLLQRHVEICGKRMKRQLSLLAPHYDITLCNTDTNLEEVVKVVKRYYAGQCDITNISILLWGPSGTGKTEFVKYLKEQTGKELIIKHASDLMSMYVGQTEKLIRAAFEEAKQEKSILFIDEADSFFVTRENAQRSFEISFVNEMLVQMENFDGVFICSTNMLQLLDIAVMRRFTLKIEFKPVKPDMRVKLYERYFVRDSNPLSLPQKQRIASLEGLTPGHVKAVYQKTLLMYDSNNHDAIIDVLEKEIQYMVHKRTKTGFSI